MRLGGDLNLLDLVFSDIFCDIQQYLALEELLNLRCVAVDFRNYVDSELNKLKRLEIPAKSEEGWKNAFKLFGERCCSLETINLCKNEWLDDDLLIPLLKTNAKTITSLNLSDCSKLTSVALQPVIIDCTRLKKLKLHNCYWLTVGCLETIAFHQTNLEELDLSNCTMIGGRTLIVLLSNFRKLQTLSLASVTNVNDNVLFSISKYQTEIVNLNLFSCKLITDRGIDAISSNCEKLETLSIRGCPLITERSLNLLRTRNVHIDVPVNPRNAFINQIQILRNREFIYLQV